jgi:hypothetical protein
MTNLICVQWDGAAASLSLGAASGFTAVNVTRSQWGVFWVTDTEPSLERKFARRFVKLIDKVFHVRQSGSCPGSGASCR